MSFPKVKRITPSKQLYGLQSLFRQGSGQVRRGSLHWVCTIRSTPLSRDYTIRITYKPRFSPSVFVLCPSLKELAEGRRIPHLYSQEKEKLCLYMPGRHEWRPDMLIAKTIVPWAYTWFFYFEEWLESNDWKGGGEHPEGKDN